MARRRKSKLVIALENLCHQVEVSGAVDRKGYELKNLKSLHDARKLLYEIKARAECKAGKEGTEE